MALAEPLPEPQALFQLALQAVPQVLLALQEQLALAQQAVPLAGSRPQTELIKPIMSIIFCS
jgi:hypothetical protein